MAEKGEARHSGDYDRAKCKPCPGRHEGIVSDYERGALVAGILTACSVGACMINWAVA